MKTWLTSAGPYTVEHHPCPNPGVPVDLTRPRAGVLHTTEGSTVASALSVFDQHYAPHFLVGADRILQLVPLGTMAAALENLSGGVETNGWAAAQIEIVGFSNMSLWKPGPRTLAALGALVNTLHNQCGIPLSHPFASQLNQSITWATPSNPHRLSGKWGSVAGWYGHVDVPENDHWDCGSLNWDAVFTSAKSFQAPTAWHVTSTSPKGDVQHDKVRHPVAYALRHPKMFRRGKVTFDPQHGGGG